VSARQEVSEARLRSLRWKKKPKYCSGWFVMREKHCFGWRKKPKKPDYKRSEQSLREKYSACSLVDLSQGLSASQQYFSLILNQPWLISQSSRNEEAVCLLVSARPYQPANSIFLSQQISTNWAYQPANRLTISVKFLQILNQAANTMIFLFWKRNLVSALNG